MNRGANNRLPYEEMFTAYCTVVFGRYPSYEDIAKKYNCNVRTVQKIASKNKWVNRRAEAEKRARDNFFENKDDLIKQANINGYESWEKLLRAINIEIELLTKFQSAFLQKFLNGEIDPEIARRKNKAYSDDFRNFASALKDSINGQRVILGLPTEVSKGEVTTINKNGVLTNEDLEKLDKRLNNYGIQQQQTTDNPTN